MVRFHLGPRINKPSNGGFIFLKYYGILMQEDRIFLELLKAMNENEVEMLCRLLSANKEDILNNLMVELLKKYKDFIPSFRQNGLSY